MANISYFEIFRSSDGGATEDLTSTSVYATIHLDTTNTANLGKARLTLEYSSIGFDDLNSDSKDISASFGVTSSASVEKTKLIGTFGTSHNHYFILYYYDGTEWTQASGVIFGSDIPLAIAENNCGVAVGGKPLGNANFPMFQSYWPAYFHGGIDDFGSQWIGLTPINGTQGSNYGGGPLRCRAIENWRIIEGSVLISPGSDTVVVAELPNVVDWAPMSAIFSINACQGARIARIAVGGLSEENKGKLCISWVRNLSDGSLYTGDPIWVQCSIQYWMPVGDYG